VITATNHCDPTSDNFLQGGFQRAHWEPVLNRWENSVTILSSSFWESRHGSCCLTAALMGLPPPQIECIAPLGDVFRSPHVLPAPIPTRKSVASVGTLGFAADGAPTDLSHRSTRAEPFCGSKLTSPLGKFPFPPPRGSFLGSLAGCVRGNLIPLASAQPLALIRPI
jgi:hypothetical protein